MSATTSTATNTTGSSTATTSGSTKTFPAPVPKYYASYDPNQTQPVQVSGWYESLNYPKLDFTAPGFLEITAAQYQARYTGDWAVNGGALEAYTPPALTLADAQASQIKKLNSACGAAIVGGFQATINGTPETLTLTADDQRNALMAATTAQTTLQSSGWSADTTYAANTTVSVGGEILVTFAGGKSGSTAPKPPTAFHTAVTDGTVDWYRVGFWIGTATGNVMVDPATVISLYGEGVTWVNACRSKYQALKAQVQAATAVADVQAVVWA